jgi:hypothetical protein
MSPKNRHNTSAQTCRSRGSRNVVGATSAPRSFDRRKFVQRERRGGPDWPWRSNAIASQWIARACEKADNLDMLIPDMLPEGQFTQLRS